MAADANADPSDDGGAADAGPLCARMRIAATTYATRFVMPSPPLSKREGQYRFDEPCHKETDSGWLERSLLARVSERV